MRPKHFLNFDNFSKEDLSNIINRAIEIDSTSDYYTEQKDKFLLHLKN